MCPRGVFEGIFEAKKHQILRALQELRFFPRGYKYNILLVTVGGVSLNNYTIELHKTTLF